MAVYDYRIAAGHNVALNSLVNIEDITPAGDRPFFPPKAYGYYNAGQYRIRGDGTLYIAGFASLTWLFDVLTRKQYEYLRDTYCNGGFSGKVTLYTRLGRLAYSRMNAIMILPSPSATDGGYFAFKNYGVQMARLVASS